MIKLILKPKTQPISYIFDKDRVVIGHASEKDPQPDLPLPIKELLAAHIRIEELDGCYIAFNLANDPSMTINGKTFRKRLLQSGDLIEIAAIPIQFQEGNSPENEESLENLLDRKMNRSRPEIHLDSAVQDGKVMQDFELESFNNRGRHSQMVKAPPVVNDSGSKDCVNLPSSTAESRLKSQPTHDEIDALLKRVEELEAAFAQSKDVQEPKNRTREGHPRQENLVEPSPVEAIPLETSPVEMTKPWVKHQSLKDDYLRHLEDDNQQENQQKNSNDVPSSQASVTWKTLVTLFCGTLLFFCLALGIFYVTLVDRGEKEEVKVASEVADVVMSLKFAQFNKALAQNQNWSDPDFLKHNLAAVLASGYKPLADIDSHGQITGTSYILRIYTSSDLSHFLVIAQPHANLLQWLIPKSIIIVDSQLMELRKNHDLRTLNRLLVDPTLDGSNRREIANLVRQGELIPLERLSELHKDTGFGSPRALAYIRPGAENFIYNALRYYQFGESIIKKTLALQNQDNEYDRSLLMQEIDAIMKLKNIVLYTTEGLKSALEAQKALAKFVPQHKFMLGYLQLNHRGQAHSGHLLIDDNHTELVPKELVHSEGSNPEGTSPVGTSPVETSSLIADLKGSEETQVIQASHPAATTPAAPATPIVPAASSVSLNSHNDNLEETDSSLFDNDNETDEEDFEDDEDLEDSHEDSELGFNDDEENSEDNIIADADLHFDHHEQIHEQIHEDSDEDSLDSESSSDEENEDEYY